MEPHYLVEIQDPHLHIVKVILNYQKKDEQDKLYVTLPSWSPGSYLMREYSKNLRIIKANSGNGETLFVTQLSKNCWEIDWPKSQLKGNHPQFSVEYEIYCHEWSVRNAYIDESMAFLHGPHYLIDLKDENHRSLIKNPLIEFKFPALWSKLTSSLKNASSDRERFIYSAKDYDELLDQPVAIGCHETDGFMHEGRPHELAFSGTVYPHENNLKEDIKKIVETVSGVFPEPLPYEKYTFINYFAAGSFGGLEHRDSCALHFDGRKMPIRQDYINWLSLVAHEYFHLWNIKRIRPVELGPFDYSNENYTTMLWLAEGLTSFMDDLFVYRAGLCTLSEYLNAIKGHFERYFKTPGKRFHSLEQSSFNAWVKLYRPDENTHNSTVSYYNKGGIAFFLLNILLCEKGAGIDQFISCLWKRYLDNPKVGVNPEEVFGLIENLAGKKVRDEFEVMVQTTFDLDIEKYVKKMGLSLVWDHPSRPYLGVSTKNKNGQLTIESVVLDGPAYKCGLNAGDEVVAINSERVRFDDFDTVLKGLKEGKNYHFLVSRLNKMVELYVTPEKTPRKLVKIAIENENKVNQNLLNSNSCGAFT